MIKWLQNAVLSLAVSGLYAIVVASLRAPYLNQLLSGYDLFRPCLVVHVNLSVLIWMLCITAYIWSIGREKFLWGKLYNMLCTLSIILMGLSPFLIHDQSAIMNNYIPMLDNIWFIIALSIFTTVILCNALEVIFISCLGGKATQGSTFQDSSCQKDANKFNIRITHSVQITTALMMVGIWVCCYLSYRQLAFLALQMPIELDYYYEILFWSGGHLLQFIYTQIFMYVLLCVGEYIKKNRLEYANFYEFLFWLNFALSLLIFWGHIKWGIFDGQFKNFFTQHMIYTGGVAPSLLIFVLTLDIYKSLASGLCNFACLMRSVFVFSSILFLTGGLVGAAISGTNVTIPAHYHGAIVGITVAFMGFIYLICHHNYLSYSSDNSEYYPLLSLVTKNINSPTNAINIRRARQQLFILTIGQALHIFGLAAAGGYGVMRKTPGTDISLKIKLYMGMVGFGGLLAIFGGILFVYICTKAFYQRRSLGSCS